MSALPANFPVNNLSAVNRSRVEGFYRLFAENYYNEYQLGHFLLAAYAAVPSLLTPELLYRIWQNFHGYRWSGAAATIHRIAVSDVLLSSLCRETGFELYEMEPEIKLAFLEWLKKIETDKGSHWAQRGIHTIDRIASFVGYYHRSPNSGLTRWGKVYTDLQEMEVLSYADPGRLASMLLEQIRSQAAAKDENALLRTLDIFLKTQQRLDRLLPADKKIKAFDEPRQELAAIKDLLQKNEEGFLEKLQAHPAVRGQLLEVNGGGIELKVKQQVAGKMGQLEKPKVRVLAIGVEIEGGDNSGSYRGSAYDAHRVVSSLRSLLPENTPPEITLLNGVEATGSRILAALEELSRIASPADEVLIYISCSAHALTEGGCGIICSDAIGANKTGFTIAYLTDKEFNEATRRINCSSLTAIIEAPFSGAGQWLEVEEGNNRLYITSCTKEEEAGQVTNDEARYSLFTEWLIQAWDRSESYLNWREIMVSLLYWQSQASQTRDAPPIVQHPVIRGNLVSLNYAFGNTGRVSWQLETLLRQTGFYTPDSGYAYTDELKRFCLTVGLQTDFPEAQYIQPLEEYRKIQLAEMIPVYLLVFSDPDNRLQELREERAALEQILTPMDRAYKIKLLVVQDPTPDELAEIFLDPLYRNRIQVFYYSGNDDHGDFILQEGTFGIDHLGRLLNCQENIDLLIANTCRSQQLANYASQLGVRMAIGFEGVITDSMGADFGRQLFEWISQEKDLLAFEAACQSGALSFRQLADNVKPFRFFYPSWLKEPFVLTERRKRKEQPGKSREQKRKMYAAVTSYHEIHANTPNLPYSEQNAARFSQVMNNYAARLGRELEIFSGGPRQLERSSLGSLKDFYDQCGEGDTCLLFYSGMAFIDSDGTLNDIVCVDDTAALSTQSTRESVFTSLFRSIAEANRGHVLIILDIQGYSYESSVVQSLPVINDGDSSFIMLVSADDLPALNRNPPGGNHFFETLMDLLEEGVGWLTYRDLQDRLRLRMSRLTEQKPALKVLNKNVEDTIVFTGEEKIHNAYRLYWSKELNSWIVDAGSLQGIRPSLSFMHTVFSTQVGQQVTATRVQPNHSEVEAFEGDVTIVYPVTLVQNALPKVKIAFAPSIFHAMRERMEQAIRQYDIYYTELVTTVADAVYFIGNRDDQYLLIRRADLQTDAPAPVFDYQSDPYELIRQIEYIAQWQGVLEFNNPGTRLGRGDIWFTFEKVEGANRNNRETIPGKIVHDDEPVELYYTKENGQWLQPALRCRAAVVKRPVYIFIMYLDARYGITYLGSNLLEPSSAGEYISFKLDYRERDQRTLLFRLERQYEERGMTRITEYMKFFVSEGPVDFDRLRQQGLEFGEATMRKATDSDIRADSLNTSSADWISYTIPIRIIKEESKESETPVQQEKSAATSEAQPPNKPKEATRQTPSLHILFLYGRSRDQELLRMQYDIQHIRNAIQRSSMRDKISFTVRLVEKSHDIIEGLVSYKPTIVHLSGLSDQGWSIQTEIGEPQLVTTEMLLHLFEQHMDFIQCVILEGVYTDKLVSGLLLLVPYTIALTPNLTNRAVSDFYSKFYEAIANGQTIEFAFEIAQAAQSLSVGDRSSTPRLYKKG